MKDQKGKLAAGLQRARGLAGLSKSELARRVGVERGAIARWESGEAVPSDKVQLLAEELGTSVSELMAGVPAVEERLNVLEAEVKALRLAMMDLVRRIDSAPS